MPSGKERRGWRHSGWSLDAPVASSGCACPLTTFEVARFDQVVGRGGRPRGRREEHARSPSHPRAGGSGRVFSAPCWLAASEVAGPAASVSLGAVLAPARIRSSSTLRRIVQRRSGWSMPATAFSVPAPPVPPVDHHVDTTPGQAISRKTIPIVIVTPPSAARSEDIPRVWLCSPSADAIVPRRAGTGA
jgi:hypothetical protein